ncbi:hypothetical protein [Maribacter sp. HTCC2170]|uniref:hypothetical protein n=1 Tax=Maribacter sp. (strain HTCC2170 / KCCM 42371) TaxID=313603 RepID=UPI0011D1E533|nr:hypothetical protein [Maribacter sp. HTCC2170]
MDTFCKKGLILALAIFVSQAITAQIEVSKQVTETYSMTNAGELHLENKYGNINLFGWDKDEVSIVIDIVVNHKKKDNAQDLLKRMNPVIKDGDDYVSINYEIAEKSSGFFGNLFEKANPFDFDRSNVQIDYTIYLPVQAEIDVTNKFGDVLIEDWTGKLKANVTHGDIWISENLTKADIEMGYGKLRARSIDYASIGLKNGSLDMETTKNLRLNSSGSNIYVDSVTSLEVYSNKDEIEIETIGAVYGNLKYTNMVLSRLDKDIDLTMKIADFRVSQVLNPQADIAIKQESSEIVLDVTNFPLHFDAILEQGVVRLPKSFENVDSKMLDKGKRIREISATYGKNPQGKISISGKKGVVLLKE